MITLLKQIYQGFVQAWKADPEVLEHVSPLKVIPFIRGVGTHSNFLLDLKRCVVINGSVMETAPLAVFNRTFNLMELSRPHVPPFRQWSSYDVFSVNVKLSNVYVKIRKGWDEPVICKTPLPLNAVFTKVNDGGYSNYIFKVAVNNYNFIGLGNSFIFSFTIIGEINLLTGELRISIPQQPTVTASTVVPSAVEITGYDIETSWTPLEALANDRLIDSFE